MFSKWRASLTHIRRNDNLVPKKMFFCMPWPWDYSSECKCLAEVSFRVMYGAPWEKSIRNARANLYNSRTPRPRFNIYIYIYIYILNWCLPHFAPYSLDDRPINIDDCPHGRTPKLSVILRIARATYCGDCLAIGNVVRAIDRGDCLRNVWKCSDFS